MYLCWKGSHAPVCTPLCRPEPKIKYDVYVCTAANRDYALEAWRILDHNRRLIPPKQYSTRIWNVPAPGDKFLDQVMGLRPQPVPEQDQVPPLMSVSNRPLDAPRTRAPLVAIVDDRPEVGSPVWCAALLHGSMYHDVARA